MKNNKKSPLAIARRLAFKLSEPDLAILTILPPEKAFSGELDAIASLSRELVGIDTPEMVQSRVAMESTAQGYRENTPELYGRKSVEIDFGAGYKIHSANGPSADCDVEETDKALMATASHAGTNANDNDDKPEVESL